MKAKHDTKKKTLFIALILLVLFSIVFIMKLLVDAIKYGSTSYMEPNIISYIFMAAILLLGVFLSILLATVIKKKGYKGLVFKTKQRNLSTPEFDYFYLEHKKIVDIDRDLIKNYQEGEIEEVDLSLELDEYQENHEVQTKINEIKEEAKKTYITATEEKEQDEEINETGSRFYNLSKIDEKYKEYLPPKYNEEITLKEICEQFRNFSARNLRLYYDIEDIRRFIGGLSVTKLIILQGMSGTGKTSLAFAFGEFLDNTTSIIPVQPMWKERTDLVGYYNEFTRKFNETTLLYKMYEANYNKEIYITVLDEMNIARIEYYFAEFLSLLEIPNLEGRLLDVVADKWGNDPILLNKEGKLKLPYNMWFIGTANNDDSTFAISDKVYDRAMVLNLDKKAKVFDAPKTDKLKLSSSHLVELFEKAQKEFKISDRNLRRIKMLDEYMIKTFHLTFGNRIMKQIESYVPVLVACGGDEIQAIDDILSRKVFRKLEAKNPVYVRQMADSVQAYLDDLFGENKMPLCKEAIKLIEQNI